MTAYCLWDVREIHDQDAMNNYVARVTDSVTAFGGEYVVVGGPWQIVEGDWRPAHPVLIEFPSLDRAHEWYSSELYAPLRALRHVASTSDAVFFEGIAPVGRGTSRSGAAPLADVGVDVYREVHKGIRHGLFRASELAGHVDPFDEHALSAAHGMVEDLLHLLDVHAQHEDEFFGPLIGRHLPALAVQLQYEHAELDALTVEIREQLATFARFAGDDRRLRQHRLHLTLSEFTARYLLHQTTEEVDVLPALNRAAGLDELVEASNELVAAIDPVDMDGYMRLIVPAANPMDLAELYGGMREGAPAEAFDAMLDLARRDLEPSGFTRLTDDLARV
jgi:uncharacterized protein (DUF1330 family)